MILFYVEPFVGPLPLRFGMKEAEVAKLLGPPIRRDVGGLGGIDESRPNLSIGYSDPEKELYGATFSPGIKLFFHGEDLLSHKDPIEFLQKFASAFQAVGMVFFPELGIRLSGFHDGDDSQKAIEVVKE